MFGSETPAKRYRIPAGTKCKVAPDDNRTPYAPYESKADSVGVLRFELDSGWCVLAVEGTDFVVQLRFDQVERIDG